MFCFYPLRNVLPSSIFEFLEPCLDGIASGMIKCVFCNIQRCGLETGLEGPRNEEEYNIPEEDTKEGSDDPRF
jgi:hypothetical protein